MLHWRGPLELRLLPIAVLTPRGMIRTRKTPRRWSGHYPPRSPTEWLAEGHVTCSIQRLNGDCKHQADVRLDTLPQDQPWSCGAPGAVNIVPNWHDREGHAVPFSKDWNDPRR